MAYSGLPSKACANCRLRRIKCNQLEPACSQCRRAGKVCPGYRDGLSLIFRNENAKVIRKAHGHTQAPERQKTRQIDTVSPAPLVETPTTTGDFETLSIASSSTTTSSPSSVLSLRILPTPVEEQGVNFFFSRYLTSFLPAQGSSIDVSALPFWQEVYVQKPFLDAVSSVGLAGLANVKKSRALMTIARLKYHTTLQRVIHALQNPAKADLDFTIKAVVMLALFEIVNCSQESAGSWGLHVGGVIALLNSGHLEQFQEMAEVRMRLQFCFLICINCVRKQEKLPPIIYAMSRILGASLSPSDAPAASLAGFMIQYIELCISIKAGEIYNPAAIVQAALQLETSLEEWRLNLPNCWNYAVETSLDDPECTFNGQYHIYSDPWFDRMWDHYRWLRIHVHELILTNLETPSLCPGNALQQATSLVIIAQLATDICANAASVLYRLAPQPRTGFSPPGIRGIFMILWTLKIAGSAVGTSDALHSWVVTVLDKIGQTTGILQTRMVIFAMNAHREQWKRRMGYAFELCSSAESYTRDVDALSALVDVD